MPSSHRPRPEPAAAAASWTEPTTPAPHSQPSERLDRNAPPSRVPLHMEHKHLETGPSPVAWREEPTHATDPPAAAATADAPALGPGGGSLEAIDAVYGGLYDDPVE